MPMDSPNTRDTTSKVEFSQDFTRTGSSEKLTVTITSTSRDQTTLKQKTKQKAANILNYESTDELMANWTPRSTYLDWANAPWDTEEDIKNALTSIDSVTKYYTDMLHTTDRREPAIYLHTDSPKATAKAATEYYDGFTHQLEENRVIVFPTPSTA